MRDKEISTPAELGSTDAEQPQAGWSCHLHSCPGAASARQSQSQPKQQVGVQLLFQRQLSSFPPSNPSHRHSTGLPRYPLTIGLQSTKTTPRCCPPGELLSHCRCARRFGLVKWQETKQADVPSILPFVHVPSTKQKYFIHLRELAPRQ